MSVALIICSRGSLSSIGGALSSMRDGHPWVVGRGVVVVPGRCLWALGIVCGCWVAHARWVPL